MTEAMPFLQKYDITFLRPLPILGGELLYLGQEISIMRSMVSWRVRHWAVSAAL